jgi:adenylate cyclase
MGRLDEARQAQRETLRLVEEYVALHPDDVRAVYFGALAHCEIGDRPQALEWAERALAMDSEEATVLYNIACVYAQLGESGKAIDCLEKGFRKGFGHREWIENDPDLKSLRDQPRFIALMENLRPRPSKFDSA